MNMRRKIPASSPLVFARRKTTKGFQKRGRKVHSFKKVLSYGLFVILACVSIFAGYFFARFGGMPDIFKNKESERVIKPIEVSKNGSQKPIEKLLEQENVQFESVTKATTSATLIIVLGKSSFAYLDFSEDLEPQVKVLANIIKRVKIDSPGKNISYIDLRFGKPIIKF